MPETDRALIHGARFLQQLNPDKQNKTVNEEKILTNRNGCAGKYH